MVYNRSQANWENGVIGGTPIDADTMDNIEEGIDKAHQIVDKLASHDLAMPFGIHRALSLHATARCNILMAGDSRPEGTGVDSIAETFRFKYQELLRERYSAYEDTGRGYIPVVYANGEGWAEAPVASGTPSVRNLEGLGIRSVALNDASDMYTWALHGTHMRLCYAGINTGGKSEYRITPASTGTPGSWIEVDHNNAQPGFDFREEATNVTLGAEDNYTVEWRWKANGGGLGPNPIIEGIIEINGDPTKGICVLDGAHGGITSEAFVNDTYDHHLSRQVTLHSLKGTLIDILTNDWQTGSVTPDESKTALQAWIDIYQAAQDPADPYSDVVFLSGWQVRAPLGDPVADWSEYRDMIYEVADDNDYVHIIDTRRHLPEPDAPGDIPGVVDGYFDFLALHPEETGHEVLARAFFYETTPALSSNYVADPFAKMLGAGYVTGDRHNPEYTALTTRATAQGNLYFVPIFIRGPVTLDRILVEISTAGTASSTVRLGIWNHDPLTGKPGTLLVDGGRVAATSLGEVNVTISKRLTAGWYWLGVAGQTVTGSPAVRGITHVLGGLIQGPATISSVSAPNAAIAIVGGITGIFSSAIGATFVPTTVGPFIQVRVG